MQSHQTTDQIRFGRVVWFGVLANWTFAFWVLLGDANALMRILHLGELQSTLWLYHYSILLAVLSLFYIPAARDCRRYRANAWLLVVSRLIPAFTVFVGVAISFMPNGFLWLGLADIAIGFTQLWLLLRIVRAERTV